MLVEAVTLTAAAAAALACASWAVESREPGAFRRPYSTILATWAGASAVAEALSLAGGPLASALDALLFAAAALVGLIGVAGAARAVTISGGLAPAVAEAALVGTCLVAIFWVVAGSPATPSGWPILSLALTTVDVTVAALIVRLPLSSRTAVIDRRYRRQLLLASTAVALLAVGDGIDTLTSTSSGGHGVAYDVVGRFAETLGYLAAAAIPWVGTVPDAPVRRPPLVVRVLPHLLVATAVTALCVHAVLGPVDGLSVILVALVVSCLVAVQWLALRENARLLTDLDSSRARLAALVENAADVILGIDVAGCIATANQAALVLLNADPEALEGRDVAELAVLDDRERVRAQVHSVVRGGAATSRVELRLAAPAAGTAELRLRGVPGGAVAVLSDVTDAVQLRGRLERLARYDQMTGLANRSHVLDELGLWLRRGAQVTLLYADLDGFKAVNDRFGHVAGDGVLTEVAGRIVGAAASLTSGRTIVGRLGGDEFVVGLRDVTAEAAAQAAKRLVDAMRPAFSVADRTVRIGVSVGIAGTDDERPIATGPAGAADLFHRADIAMFAAKAAGRARAVRWDAALEARTMRRVDIAIGLRQALETGRLALAYQPVVRLSDGVVIGVEALIRVPGGHADSARGGEDAPDAGAAASPGALSSVPGLVTPAELVEVAEDTGLIIELGQWVLTTATNQGALWKALGYDVLVAVNMSVRQLASDGFVESVRRALRIAGLPPELLLIEITEGQLVGEGDPVSAVLDELQAEGVVLAIDDFGSGYSSLSYLRRMPVRTVKIDKTLLDGVGSDPRATTLARAVIGAARALGLLVVAEGLESLEMARTVRDIGAYAGQGFALIGALPASAMTQVLGGGPLDLGGPPTRRLQFVGKAASLVDLTNGDASVGL